VFDLGAAISCIMLSMVEGLAESAKGAGLDPALVESLEETTFGIWVKHPLVISPLFQGPEGIEMLNQTLKSKQEAVQEAIRSQNWPQVIWMHERPWRPDVLINYIPRDLEDFWELASHVWIDTEFPHARNALWRELFTRPGSERMMTTEEREHLAALPDFINVYRGTTKDVGEHGFSWTLERARAEWFANRFASDLDTPIAIEGVVSKYEIIAYIAGRGESEILVPPEKVELIAVHEC